MKTKGHCWQALPREVAQWWRRREASEITPSENREIRIRGPASMDGVVAQARLVDDQLKFGLDVQK